MGIRLSQLTSHKSRVVCELAMAANDSWEMAERVISPSRLGCLLSHCFPTLLSTSRSQCWLPVGSSALPDIISILSPKPLPACYLSYLLQRLSLCLFCFSHSMPFTLLHRYGSTVLILRPTLVKSKVLSNCIQAVFRFCPVAIKIEKKRRNWL